MINIKERPEVVVSVVLHLILGYKKFAENFPDKFPSTLADTVSYRGNPSCSCKSKIVKFVQDNHSEVIEWLSLWIENEPENDELLAAYVKMTGINDIPTSPSPDMTTTVEVSGDPINPGVSMYGRIVIIPPDPASYFQLLTKAFVEKWIFNGLTVSIKDDKWYIFFY